MNDDSESQNTGPNSSTAKQDFHQPVSSVAGRDAIDRSKQVNQSSLGDFALNLSGDRNIVLQIGQLLSSLTESTKQANFYLATGIRCGPKARDAIEDLLIKGFDSYSVSRAWDRHMVRWNNKDDRLVVNIGWSDYFVFTALLLVFGFAAEFFVLLAQMYWNDPKNLTKIFTLAGVSVFFAAIGIWVNMYVWQPYVTARQVRSELRKQHASTKADDV